MGMKKTSYRRAMMIELVRLLLANLKYTGLNFSFAVADELQIKTKLQKIIRQEFFLMDWNR